MCGRQDLKTLSCDDNVPSTVKFKIGKKTVFTITYKQSKILQMYVIRFVRDVYSQKQIVLIIYIIWKFIYNFAKVQCPTHKSIECFYL